MELGPLLAERMGTLTNGCLDHAYASLAPLRWPAEEDDLVLYTDGGLLTDTCAAAWVLRQHSVTLAERDWTIEGERAPDPSSSPRTGPG